MSCLTTRFRDPYDALYKAKSRTRYAEHAWLVYEREKMEHTVLQASSLKHSEAMHRNQA
jgi:hypothetical protein